MKRMITMILALAIALTCCLGTTFATDREGTKASITISSYSVGMKAGSSRGETRISYSITANNTADSIGVSSIVIYKSDGSRVTTISGSTSNGLICKSSGSHTGDYTYYGTSGISYYAEVTVYATVGSTTDSRTVTTSTVKAP